VCPNAPDGRLRSCLRRPRARLWREQPYLQDDRLDIAWCGGTKWPRGTICVLTLHAVYRVSGPVSCHAQPAPGRSPRPAHRIAVGVSTANNGNVSVVGTPCG
jgi:hypothetical protein